MRKTTLLIVFLLTLQTFMFAQITSVPDPVFEGYLVSTGIDSDGVVNGQILTADATGYVGNLNTAGMSVADFTGIEAFTSVTGLNINYNTAVTSIDISAMSALTSFSSEGCSNITGLTLTGLTNLASLNLFGNNLSVLDVSTNTGLVDLNVRNNVIVDLDLSTNVMLNSLNCRNNALTGLDVRNGNNANVISFDSDFNSGLTCVFVDDSSAGYLSGWSVDVNSVFANDQAECNTLSTENNAISVFNMFPNPAVDIINVTSSEQTSMIKVYNITGKLVISKVLGYGDNTVNVSELSSGVYLARFSSALKSETKKLIIN